MQVHCTFDKKAIAQTQNAYLILNLAVGGWAQQPPEDVVWPQDLEIDYVRIWKRVSLHS